MSLCIVLKNGLEALLSDIDERKLNQGTPDPDLIEGLTFMLRAAEDEYRELLLPIETYRKMALWIWKHPACVDTMNDIAAKDRAELEASGKITTRGEYITRGC